MLKLSSNWQYEDIASNIELYIQKLLEEHNYNTVGNFTSLYKSFKESGCSNLSEFFQRYDPQITPEHHTCVGLALELWKKLYNLNDRFHGLTDYLFLVSCEESIDTSEYAALNDQVEIVAKSVEKEHVLLALRFSINGRPGILLCDPGYHVGRVITVMKDAKYPHTGWFIQSEEPRNTKEYCYAFSKINNMFVEWNERNTSNDGIVKHGTHLIFVERPYLTAVDVTERRNLVYNFRSLLSRDPKGHLIAGLYFKVKEDEDEFTIFYHDNGKKREKFKFSSFLTLDNMSEVMVKSLKTCSKQLNLKHEDSLTKLLHDLAVINNDKDYIHQLLEINININAMTEV